MYAPSVSTLGLVTFVPMLVAGCAIRARDMRGTEYLPAGSEARRGDKESRPGPRDAAKSAERWPYPDWEGRPVLELAPGYEYVPPDPERLRSLDLWFRTNRVVECYPRAVRDANGGDRLELVPNVGPSDLRGMLSARGNRRLVLVLPSMFDPEAPAYQAALARLLLMLRDCGAAEVELRRASQFLFPDDERAFWKTISLKDVSLD